jgi:DNA-binding CsgD family transcriptional regulator
MGRAKLTGEQKETIDHLGQDPALSHGEIARRVGCSMWTVARRLAGAISPYERHAAQKAARVAQVAALIREGVSRSEIARRMGVHIDTVSRYASAAGLSPVSPGQMQGNTAFLASVEQAAQLAAEGLDEAMIAARLGCAPTTARYHLRVAQRAAQTPPDESGADCRALPRRPLPADHPAFWPTAPLKRGHCYPDIVLPARVVREDARRFDARAVRPDVFSGVGSPAAACAEGM